MPVHFAKNCRKIIGVAANYKELLKILNKPVPDQPGIFLKPTTSLITEGQNIVLPKDFTVNEEIELGVIIGTKAKHVSEAEAMNYVGGYCVTLDMTATDQMQKARSTGGSWTLGKGFDTACPVSGFIKKTDIADPHNVNIWCAINGKVVQNGNTSDMVFSIPRLISFISKYMTLEPNDLILSGSPPGMGPVQQGDVITGGIRNGVEIKYTVCSDE